MTKVCDEFYHQNCSWYEGLKQMSLKKSFTVYLERMVEYNMDHPEYIRIISLNLSQNRMVDTIPGYDQIVEILSRTRETLESNVAINASSVEIKIFMNSFNAIMFTFLGSSYGQAKIIGMIPDSKEYREWVINAMTYMFFNRLKSLMFG